MQDLRQAWLFVGALGLACGDKDETTASGSSETGAASSSSSGDVNPTTTAEDPTTGGSTSTGASSSSSGGAESSSGEPVVCDTAPADCGVTETDVDSFCTEPPPPGDTLVLESPGPGQLKISEVGYDQACNITVMPVVSFGPNNSIIVSYNIQGAPEGDCICKFTITTTLNDVPPGKWTVYLGPFQESIDVL